MSRDAGTIALVGFSPREQSLLEVFFASSDNPGLTLDAPQRAESLLLNVDSEAALKKFLVWYERRTPCPIIAVVDQQPTPEGMSELRRPLNLLVLRQTLQRLVRQLSRARKREEAESEEVRASTTGLKMSPAEFRSLIDASRQEPSSAASRPPLASARPAPAAADSAEMPLISWHEAEREKLVKHICGSLPDLDPDSPADRARLSISLEGQFVTWVRTAVQRGKETRRAMQLTGIPGCFIYFPQQDCFSYDLGMDLLLQMASSRFGPGELGCRELELEQPEAPQARRDEMLWLLALHTTHGRVPDHLDPRGRYRLKPVAHLERFLLPPFAQRIAARWQQTELTPLEVSRSLDIPQRYVFSFLAAADAVELFERK